MLKTILHYILKTFSKIILNKYSPDVVGITGSVGKTSSKEAVASVLSAKFNVRKSMKNYNNEIGVPLAIIGIEKSPGRSLPGWLNVFITALKLIWKRDKNYPDILVLEMGADKPGDIKYLTDLAPCRVGVLTHICHAHTEFFKTLKKIAQEKRQIISHLDKDGFAVLNYDSELVMESARLTKAEIITFGFTDGADLMASDVNIIYDEQRWAKGLNFKLNYKGNIVPAFLPGAVAQHLIPSALVGLAVGLIFGINLVEGIEALKETAPLAGHMRLIPGIKNTMLVDDTYNSSPEPTKSALQTLCKIEIAPSSRRIAVLGDMLELGPETVNTHREVGFKVAELDIDFLITVGEASKYTAAAAREAGMDDNKITSFDDSASAGKFLQEKLGEHDLILVKGSQGVRMEKVVKEVMAEPLLAKELLVRQDDYWLNK